ncbi:MAG: EutP/PduV family microcompartment system protein [Lachnospiraceae bacterium]|jgi:ethanolamine utilization protein EutP|nr:EutP/PduV family microcompartment system protein [Lachnospiraceae bacterium]
MKKIIFFGQTGCGKTTLCQRLNQQEIRYKKTQAVELLGEAIDTPGEYLENRRFYPALIMSASDAKVIALVSDPTRAYHPIPPAFAGNFSKKVIGIVTKISLASPGQIKASLAELEKAKAAPVFLVDTLEGIGIGDLTAYLDSI